ncbi:conserved hypothetical protein [Limnospira indica PCC 8005]|uniref:Uncharacterized protein n=2 Tax=Sirenicapillariaceae TaxID=2934961 RepID=A0A9P1KCC0_9CYAN|nr:conserved hypothetical protein [Limnospira indica PCC 8005]
MFSGAEELRRRPHSNQLYPISLLKIMFTQFRSRYPTGGLISELIAIENNQYIVRVSVQVAGVTLASGLGMAETVELAEDRARERSLQCLGLHKIGDNLPKADLPNMEDSLPSPVVYNLSNQSAVDSPTTGAETLGLDSMAMPSDEWLSATYMKPKTGSPSLPDATTTQNPAQTKARGASLPHLPSDELETPENTIIHEPEPPSVTLSQGTRYNTAYHVDDMSDDIAKTDIELRRLGWTAEQGSTHLLKTYGKRSRRHLTPEELLDFLHYLQSI